ncbi:MAG: RagB/SusD family nutrient uptake outer membrane protein [Bacteroidales bacterium]|nr:RagB/SusD family nutrient uptake outer membrane protein [Bacteroidales bacterium]
MKKLIISIFTICSLFTSVACSDWLTVYPKTETPVEQLLSDEQGYEDALAGVYILMKNSSLYGGGLSFSYIENLANLWDVTNQSVAQSLSLHRYTDAGASSVIDNIYGKLYNAIANLNAILIHIDESKEVLVTQDMYEIIKGEALALRAFLHFDILRLFGPLPESAQGSDIRLSYITTLSKDVNTPISFEQYKTCIWADLEEAQKLLKEVDPILHYAIDDLKYVNAFNDFSPKSEFFLHRVIRMNYYATKALEARCALWFQETERACNAALEVINASYDGGQNLSFRLGTSGDFGNGNYVLPCEHIFAIHDYSLYSKYTANFSSGNLKKGENESIIKSKLFSSTGTDIRELSLWEQIALENHSNIYTIKKYSVPEKISNIYYDYRQIPLIRLSEMYLIATETAPLSDAQTLWETYCASRGIVAQSLPANLVDRRPIVLNEFRKEFYAEGQLFYLYKRYNSPKEDILFSTSDLSVNYVLPLPVTEIK